MHGTTSKFAMTMGRQTETTLEDSGTCGSLIQQEKSTRLGPFGLGLGVVLLKHSGGYLERIKERHLATPQKNRGLVPMWIAGAAARESKRQANLANPTPCVWLEEGTAEGKGQQQILELS